MDFFNELGQLFESEDGDLFKPKTKRVAVTAEGRLIESFNEICRFVEITGRKPDPEAEDLKEASLGARLNSIRTDKKKADALSEYDGLGLLDLDQVPESLEQLFADDSGLFSNTEGMFDDGPGKVISSERPRPAEEIAERKPAVDFEKFKSGFEEQQRMLSTEECRLRRYLGVQDLKIGGYYIHDGQMLRIVDATEKKRVYDRNKERFRVIFENGTESNMYRRSLSQRLREDGYTVAREELDKEDTEKAVGRIYVLQSLSNEPRISTIKDLYKIGVTLGSVKDRVKNAANDPTYLMAPVKIVEDFRLTGEFNPQKVEALIHRVFNEAKVELTIVGNDKTIYTPNEWYSAPLPAILDGIELIATGEIVDYMYSREEEKMVNVK